MHALAAACGGDDGPGATSTPLPDGGAGDVVETADVILPSQPDGGGLGQVVDVPDTPCSPRGGTEQVLYADAGLVPSFVVTGRVGARRMAATRFYGFSVFDLDGTNPSMTLIMPGPETTHAATIGSRVLAAWEFEGSLFETVYDAQGARAAALDYAVASAPITGVAAGGGEDVGLVVWAEPQTIRARAVLKDGALAGAPIDLLAGIPAGDFSGAVAHAGGTSFGIAWAAGTQGDHRLYFIPTSTTAAASLPRRLLTRADAITVLSLVRTQDGFALLVQLDGAPHLVRLDGAGKIVPPAFRLLGTAGGLSLAASGDELGVLAIRAVAAEEDGGTPADGGAAVEPGPIEFRPFDKTGALAPWVCLGATPRGDARAAIDAEGNGYAIVHRTATADLALLRIDRRGAGP